MPLSSREREALREKYCRSRLGQEWAADHQLFAAVEAERERAAGVARLYSRQHVQLDWNGWTPDEIEEHMCEQIATAIEKGAEDV